MCSRSSVRRPRGRSRSPSLPGGSLVLRPPPRTVTLGSGRASGPNRPTGGCSRLRAPTAGRAHRIAATTLCHTIGWVVRLCFGIVPRLWVPTGLSRGRWVSQTRPVECPAGTVNIATVNYTAYILTAM